MNEPQAVAFVVVAGVALIALAHWIASAAEETHNDIWQRERYKDMYRDDEVDMGIPISKKGE